MYNVQKYEYMSIWVWRPAFSSGNHPLLLFYLICWGKISQSNPELAGETSLASQLPVEIPPQAFEAAITGRPTFLWILVIPTNVSSCLHGKHFTHWAISSASSYVLNSTWGCICYQEWGWEKNIFKWAFQMMSHPPDHSEMASMLLCLLQFYPK